MNGNQKKQRIFNGHVAAITLLCLFVTWDEFRLFVTDVFSFNGDIVMNVILTLSALTSVYIFVRKLLREKEIDLSCIALLALCLLFLVVENERDPEASLPAVKVERIEEAPLPETPADTLDLETEEMK